MDTDGVTLHPAARPSTPSTASATTPGTAAGGHAECGGGGGGGAARWARGRCACEGEAQAQAADDDEGEGRAAAYRRIARLQPRPPPRAHCSRRRTRVPGLALAALLGALLAAGAHLNAATTAPAEDPEFTEQIENITVPAGRNVKLACSVKNLGTYKVAWMHFEQSAILTVHNHVITRNPRISVSHDKHRTWFLHISNVQEEDKGRYMCQINTVTAKTQFGFLHVVVERGSNASGNPTAHISQERDGQHGRNGETKERTGRNEGEALTAVEERKRKAKIARHSAPCIRHIFPTMGTVAHRVPPNIDDSLSSSDVIVREGANVTLTCHATGSPPPSVKWKRDDGSKIAINKSTAVLEWEGEVLEMTRISRLDMGAYLCIASNGVPPTVSKRIKVSVDFPPMLWIPHQLVGAPLGYSVTLECFTEAHPTSLNYWTRDDGHMIHESRKYRADNTVGSPSYKTHMKLTINNIQERDYGTYKCVAKNPRGETDGTIRLYTSAPPSTTPGPTSTDLPRRNPDQPWEGASETNNSVYTNPNHFNGLHGDKGKGSKYQSNLNEIDKSEQKSAFDSSGKGVVYEWPQPDAGAGGGARGLRACGCGGAGLALALALPVAALGLGMAHSRAPAPAR